MARTLALIFRLAQAPHRFRRALRPSYGPMLGDMLLAIPRTLSWIAAARLNC